MNRMSFKTMVATISLVAVVPTSLGVLACNSTERLVKTPLNDVITIREVEGKVANDEESVLEEIARLNPNLEISGVEIKNFNKATDITPGSAIIATKVNGKYTGEVGITVTSLVKTDLNQLIKVKEVSGSAVNTPETVFAKILELNKESDIAVQEVEIKDFIPATILDGSAIIAAKPSSIKYTGEVNIKIKGLSYDAEKKVVDEINSDKFSKSVNLGIKVVEVKDSTNAKFIRDRLSAEIEEIFNNNLFTLNKISNDKGEELTDEDFVTITTINTKINYDYGSMKNQDTQLIITVKQIDITEERNLLLEQIKDKSDKGEDDYE